jgi:hypothetical protein
MRRKGTKRDLGALAVRRRNDKNEASLELTMRRRKDKNCNAPLSNSC